MSKINVNILRVVFASLALCVVAVIIAMGTPNQTSAAKEKPHVVKETWHKPPKQVKKTVKFTPWAQPTVSQVHKIIAFEQAKWGGPHLTNRIRCESTFRWNATNGQYRGLLQFGPIWDSMWSGTPRKVVLVNKKVVKKPFVRYRKWSHLDEVVRKVTGYRNQTVWTVKKGWLPKNSDPYHGWAAVRVGQRAVSGHGANTMWSCGL